MKSNVQNQNANEEVTNNTRHTKAEEIETVRFDIPKTFWKHFDLFRRGKLSISNFSHLSQISEQQLLIYLSQMQA